ncbi:MAG: hypothetical protein H0Z53_01680 [Nitrosospira sp.]|nr:hypothetical protein [Nitrosospira sp.]MBI0413181.1 hypothetical protein [Nitrosospira sp.]
MQIVFHYSLLSGTLGIPFGHHYQLDVLTSIFMVGAYLAAMATMATKLKLPYSANLNSQCLTTCDLIF